MKYTFYKVEIISFYFLLLLGLLPVWTVSCLLTGDGPCHLYNSRIMLDWLQGKHVAMYSQFMYPNPHLNPNCITNLVQIPLLAVFPPLIAEKMFYTIYVLGFAFGFRFLVRQINARSLYLCGIVLLFAWHHIVFKGFFNNTLSIAVWFWGVGCWLKYKDASWSRAMLIQMPLALLSYLSHPVGFACMGAMIACLLIGETLSCLTTEGYKAALKLFWKHFSRLFIAYIPALILLFSFILRRSWIEEQTGYNSEVWENFIRMPALVGLNYKEEPFAIATSLFCFLLLIVAVIYRLKEKMLLQKRDGLFLFVLLVFWVIISPPSGIMGGFDVPRRLVMLPLLAILFFAAIITPPKWLQVSAITFAFIAGAGFLAVRLPILWQTSAFASEIISCKDKITPLSTVMTLNYDRDPHNVKGEKIIDAEWTNIHTGCYIGTFKPVILADNYELNTDYFPLAGKPESNFYYHMRKDGYSFEGDIPRIDLANYKRVSGFQVDYIIFAGMNSEQKTHPYTLEAMQQLEQDYEKIYTSPNGVAVLYRNRSGFKNKWLR